MPLPVAMAGRMKLAILETGLPPEGLREQFGSYPDMMARLIGNGFAVETFDAQSGASENR